jgi:hypothetical protein
MYVPPQFIHLFLEHRLTPHQALVSVHSALAVEGNNVAYQPLMDWLRVTATEQGHVAIERVSGLATPIMAVDLQGCLMQLVHQDLPGWNVPATTRGPPMDSNARQSSGTPSHLETLLADIIIAQQPQGAPTSTIMGRTTLICTICTRVGNELGNTQKLLATASKIGNQPHPKILSQRIRTSCRHPGSRTNTFLTLVHVPYFIWIFGT